MMNSAVVYINGESKYPLFPYEPSESFPELIKVNTSDEHTPGGIYNEVDPNR